MSRIRTIKPEFPQSETVGRLSRDGRLLFIMLWTIVDDEGRARAASRMLASLLYPYDDDARDLMSGWLEELERENCIRLYQIDGSSYLEITNWRKHQKIDKPSASKLPAFVAGSPNAREHSRKVATDLVPVPSTGTMDQELSLRSSNAREAKAALETEFSETFYPAYPHKVQRAAAWRAWPRARAKASLEQIMAGLERYVLEKPPDRHWQNPATFLNGESWNDQPASPPIANGKTTPHETLLRSIARVVEKRGGLGGGEADPDERVHDHAGPAPPPRGMDDDLEIPLALRRH